MSKVQVKEKEYIWDPKEAGVELGKSGQPTSKGWSIVTPEMWKFRWSIADKVQVPAPEYYSDPDAYIDMTKSIVMKEVLDENPKLPKAIYSATVTERLLDRQNIKLRPYEMIIGMVANDQHGILFDAMNEAWGNIGEAFEKVPEKLWYWKDGKRVPMTKEEFDEIKNEIAPKFNCSVRVEPRLTEEERHMYFCPEAPGRYWETFASNGQRANPDHDWYLHLGLRKLIEMKSEKLEQYEKELELVEKEETADYKKVEGLKEKIDNAKASIQVAEAVVRWIKRQAETARKAAPQMPDEKSKKIAEQVAKNCDWVAENVPRTFWEALQLYWSVFCVYYAIEAVCHTGAFKQDRSFYPWFKKDVLEDKTLDRVKAAELLACWAAKYHETAGYSGRFGSMGKSGQGTRDYSVWTIGGQDKYGKDATNELTRLMLDVWDGYRLHFPDLKFRWFPGTQRDDLKRVCEVARTGLGLPSLRNDLTAIPSLLDMYPGELTLEEAREWGIIGCNTPGSTINSKGVVRRDVAYPEIEKSVEFTLFNGRDPEPGFEWVRSVETGDPTKFKDFEEYYQAWLKQYEWIITKENYFRNMHLEEMESIIRRPFVSLLYESCMESGKDALNDPTIARYSFQSMVGWVDVIDCLIGVKYWIYDKKKYTMEQLLKALKADWEGYEDMRQDFRNAPKFGNDDDYADDVMVKATNDTYWIHRTKTKDRKGYPIFPNQLPISRVWQSAPYMGAGPNGRKRGDQMCDGGINPHPEFDKSGAWARLRSALKVDQAKQRAYIYNQRLDYGTLEGDVGLDKFTDFCLTALQEGQNQVQVNFVSNEMLKDAQKQPEKYPYLTVRVSGYNAFFTGLPKFVQEAVMSRVEQKL